MCGIYFTNIPYAEKEVAAKLNSIRFRGPDNTGICQVNNLMLGHLRLSILDLEERSNQPMTHEHLHIVFNGEIYNFLSVKEELIALGYTFNTTSDTEVLLAGYQQWGEAIVPKLNGMFAFSIYDTLAQKVFSARDRLGVKPFYYYWKDGQFEICSQLRPLSAGKEISEEAVAMFLDCNYVPSPYSIFKDVYKLPPGYTMTFDLASGEMKQEKYWDLQPVSEKNISYEEAQEKLHELLKDAVKIRLQSDVPIGSFLSGGIDSSLVSCIASGISNEPINTFSIGFEDPQFDESKIAAQFAKIMGSNHTETICKSEDIMALIPTFVKVFDEPFADSSALPSLLLNSVTKQYVTVALSGDGGDESFLGYNHFDWVRKYEKLIRVPYFLRYLASYLIISPVFKKRTQIYKNILRTKDIHSFIKGVFSDFNSIVKTKNAYSLAHYDKVLSLATDPIQKDADLNIKLWLENDSNVKVDRASMAYSVEVRSPFMDYRIVEFARTLPVSYRYMPGRKKRILRDILKKYIPEEIFDQPKRGFAVPIGTWIRKELREEFVTNLSDDFLDKVPHLNVPKFKEMLRLHLEGSQDYASYIWKVYVLSKWYQEFGFYKRSA